MRVLILIALTLLCALPQRLLAAERLLLDVLHEYAREHRLSFTIEYIPPDPTTIGRWRSKPVDGLVTTKSGDDPERARAVLETGLRDWLVIPSVTSPRIWHLIDRQLVTRSPMDGQVSGLTHEGTASTLVDVLAKDQTLRVLTPVVFATGEVGRGAPVHLDGFRGRIRDALTVSFGDDASARQTVQWVAECSENPAKELLATIRIQPSPRTKVNTEPSK